VSVVTYFTLNRNVNIHKKFAGFAQSNEGFGYG
jgi:hypothetical protein